MDVSNTPTPQTTGPNVLLANLIFALRQVSAIKPSSLGQVESKVQGIWKNLFQSLSQGNFANRKGMKNASTQSVAVSVPTLQQPKASKEEDVKRPTAKPLTPKCQKAKVLQMASDEEEDIWFDTEEEPGEDWKDVWFDAPQSPTPINKSSSRKIET